MCRSAIPASWFSMKRAGSAKTWMRSASVSSWKSTPLPTRKRGASTAVCTVESSHASETVSAIVRVAPPTVSAASHSHCCTRSATDAT